VLVSSRKATQRRRTPAEYFAGDPALIGCWPLTEDFSDAVPRRDEIVGADILEGHGSFSIDGDAWWTAIGAGWTIAGGVASFNAGTYNEIYKTGIATSGKYYKVTYKISAMTGNGVRAKLGTAVGLSRNAVGTYTEYFMAIGTDVVMSCFAGTCTVDNLTVQEVFTFAVGGNHLIAADLLNGHGDFAIDADPFFSIGAGWTIAGGVATFNSAVSSNLTKSLVAVVGKTYEHSISCTITSGKFRVVCGATFSNYIEVSGTYNVQLLQTTGLAVNVVPFENSNFTIDNWTVREVFPGRFTNNGCLLIGNCLQSTRPMNLNTQKMSFLCEVGNMVPSVLQNIISHEYISNEIGGWAISYSGPGGNFMVEFIHRGDAGYSGLDLWNHGLGSQLTRMFAGTIDISRSNLEDALYVDGSLPTPGNLTRPYDSNNTAVIGNNPIFIGGYGGVASIAAQMTIKNVAIFNRVLSAEEIADYTAWQRDDRSPRPFSLFTGGPGQYQQLLRRRSS